jgi:hypothetical protein
LNPPTKTLARKPAFFLLRNKGEKELKGKLFSFSHLTLLSL